MIILKNYLSNISIPPQERSRGENGCNQPKKENKSNNLGMIFFQKFRRERIGEYDDKREKKKVLFEMKLPIIEGAKEGEK